ERNGLDIFELSDIDSCGRQSLLEVRDCDALLPLSDVSESIACRAAIRNRRFEKVHLAVFVQVISYALPSSETEAIDRVARIAKLTKQPGVFGDFQSARVRIVFSFC